MNNIVCALTSWKPRLPYAHIAIQSVLDGNVKPYKIVLVVYKKDAKYISPELHKMIDNKSIEIIFCDEDLKCAKRWYYTFKKYSNNPILILDDDLIYPKTMLSDVIHYMNKYPNDVITRNGRPIFLDSNNTIRPFLKTHYQYRMTHFDFEPSYLVHFLCGYGTLFPPKSININDVDINIVKKYMQIDEVTLMHYLLKNNTKTVTIPYKKWEDIAKPINIKEVKECALWNLNKNSKNSMHNDIGYRELIYPELKRLYPNFDIFNKKLLTICIPVYNTSVDKFKKCIESIKSQSLCIKNLDIIIVDDGSTNEDIITYLNQLQLDGFTVIFEKHKGVSNARNVALSNVKTDYVTFMDSDDYYINNNVFLKIQQHIVYNPNCDIIVGSREDINNNINNEFVIITNEEDKIKLSNPCNVFPQTKIYRTSFLKDKNIVWKNYECAGDRLFYFTALKHAKCIIGIGETIIHYEKGNISSTHSFQKSKDIILVELEIAKIVKNHPLSVCVANNIKDIIRRLNAVNSIKQKEVLNIAKQNFVLYTKIIKNKLHNE